MHNKDMDKRHALASSHAPKASRGYCCSPTMRAAPASCPTHAPDESSLSLVLPPQSSDIVIVARIVCRRRRLCACARQSADAAARHRPRLAVYRWVQRETKDRQR